MNPDSLLAPRPVFFENPSCVLQAGTRAQLRVDRAEVE